MGFGEHRLSCYVCFIVLSNAFLYRTRTWRLAFFVCFFKNKRYSNSQKVLVLVLKLKYQISATASIRKLQMITGSIRLYLIWRSHCNSKCYVLTVWKVKPLIYTFVNVLETLKKFPQVWCVKALMNVWLLSVHSCNPTVISFPRPRGFVLLARFCKAWWSEHKPRNNSFILGVGLGLFRIVRWAFLNIWIFSITFLPLLEWKLIWHMYCTPDLCSLLVRVLMQIWSVYTILKEQIPKILPRY